MPAWCLVLGGSFHTTSVGKCLYDLYDSMCMQTEFHVLLLGG